MPNRILRESICTSDEIDGLTPFQEVTFYRMLVQCDDYGRLDARARLLRSRLYPVKAVAAADVADAVAALARAGLIRRYAWDGGEYLLIANWDQHQKLRKKRERYPGPDGWLGLPEPKYGPSGPDAARSRGERDDAGRDDAGRDDGERDDAGRDDAGRDDAGRDDAGRDDGERDDAERDGMGPLQALARMTRRRTGGGGEGLEDDPSPDDPSPDDPPTDDPSPDGADVKESGGLTFGAIRLEPTRALNPNPNPTPNPNSTLNPHPNPNSNWNPVLFPDRCREGLHGEDAPDRAGDDAPPVGGDDRSVDGHFFGGGRGTGDGVTPGALPAALPGAAPGVTPNALPDAPAFLMRGGAVREIGAGELARYGAAYPGVDVDAELRRAALWLATSSKPPGHQRGLSNFIAHWLRDAQDRARAAPDAPEPRRPFGRWPGPRRDPAQDYHQRYYPPGFFDDHFADLSLPIPTTDHDKEGAP